MVLKEKLILPSKVLRFEPIKSIYNLFIFNKSGICVYGKNFNNNYQLNEKQLISSFFTAIMSFTKAIMSKKVKTIEMGNIKFVVVEKGILYYCFLCDSLENLTLLEELIVKIDIHFVDYINKNKIDCSIEYIYDESLNQQVDDIIDDVFSTEFDLDIEEKIIEYIESLSLNDEIKGISLSTNQGNVIYSTLNRLDLRNLLKEIDFRVKIWNNSILKLFYTSKNNELIFSDYIEDLYFIILVFNINTKIGVAEYYLKKIVAFIKNALNK